MIPLQTSLATFKADFSLFMCSLAQYIGTPRKPKPLKILTSQHGPKQAKQPLKLINLVIFVNFTTELNSLKFARNGTARPVIWWQSYGDGLTPKKITAPSAQP